MTNEPTGNEFFRVQGMPGDIAAGHLNPLSVACGRCKAMPGVSCRSDYGRRRFLEHAHWERMHAAKAATSDDEADAA